MILKDNLAPFVNFAIVAILIIFALLGIKKGFIKQFLELLSFIVALVVSLLYAPIISRFFPLYRIKLDIIYNSEILKIINYRLNAIIWFVILFVLMSIILLIVKMLINTLGDLPVVTLLNRFLGGCFGLVQGFLIVMLGSIILSNAFFINGAEFKNLTLLRKFDVIGTSLVSYFAQTIEENEAVQSFVRDPSAITESQRQLVEKWLTRNGYNKDQVNSVFNSIRQEQQ